VKFVRISLNVCFLFYWVLNDEICRSAQYRDADFMVNLLLFGLRTNQVSLNNDFVQSSQVSSFSDDPRTPHWPTM
jgi:hypothetical protein